MNFNRRTLITTVTAVSGSVLAGCLGGDQNGGDGGGGDRSRTDDPNPDEWTEVDIEFGGVEYDFEDDLEGANYAENQPIELVETQAQRKEDKLKITATFETLTQIIRGIEVRLNKYHPNADEPYGGNDIIHSKEPGEEVTIEIESQGTRTGTNTEYSFEVSAAQSD